MRIATIIQAHHSDLVGQDVDPLHYSAGALARLGVAPLWLACAAVPQNAVFHSIASDWGARAFFGSVDDVITRLIGCAEAAGLEEDDDVIVRATLNRPWINADFVGWLIDRIHNERPGGRPAEWIGLPKDFDIVFGADVFRLGLLRRADREIADPVHRFRPWLWMERNSVAHVDEMLLGSWPVNLAEMVRAADLHGDRDSGTCPVWMYRQVASRWAWNGEPVLDCACGSGDGTAVLHENGVLVRGCDVDPAAVEHARATHPGIGFDVKDGEALDYPDGSFGAVVSLDTIEHVRDDRAFLLSLRRVIRPGGRLIIGTPILRRRPIGVPTIVSHLREYESPRALAALLAECGFDSGWPSSGFGIARGLIVGPDDAREGMIMEARAS